ncbi:MAG TPA: hypothetical protein ENK02_01395, partial [Planctomycetes bacterium]|nr:hypothetical protein [Planctomycetota bacterium]
MNYRSATSKPPPLLPPLGLWSLVIFAVLRLLLFQVAFPPFSPVDEVLHWDTVQKYARLGFPEGGLPPFEDEVLEQYLLYQSPEYLNTGTPPPHPLLAPPELRRIHLETHKREWRKVPNYMAWEPPLYYLGAAV